MKGSSRQAKIKEAQDKIEDYVKELAEEMRNGVSNRLLEYLNFSAQFHHYSISNQMLIWIQRPTATHVAGMRTWNKVGRKVNQGEKGIMILAPIIYNKKTKHKEPADQEDEPDKAIYFRSVYVFDVSQTTGEPIPSGIEATGNATKWLTALHGVIQQQGISLVKAHDENTQVILGNAQGISTGGQIIIRGDMTEADEMRTLVHELAHELLHQNSDPKPPKAIRETEADATAYVVLRHFELHCNASDYLLLYDSNADILMSRLKAIHATAAQIIDGIDHEVDDTSQESVA